MISDQNGSYELVRCSSGAGDRAGDNNHDNNNNNEITMMLIIKVLRSDLIRYQTFWAMFGDALKTNNCFLTIICPEPSPGDNSKIWSGCFCAFWCDEQVCRNSWARVMATFPIQK